MIPMMVFVFPFVLFFCVQVCTRLIYNIFFSTLSAALRNLGLVVYYTLFIDYVVLNEAM